MEARAENSRSLADLTAWIAAVREEAGVPALAALVMRDGKTIASAAVGERAVGSGVLATVDDRWHLGSISKSMTATLVARLAEKGAVSWDDTIGDALGDALPEMRAAYRGASFRHLLSHRAGLQKDIPLSHFPEFGQRPADPIAERRKWAALALSQEPAGPLETTFAYSNDGYVIAAAMLEARTGKTWERLVADEVFAPLGLNSAGFGPPGTEGAYDAPRGHGRVDGKLQAMGLEIDNPGALGPAGRIHMSLADLVRYADAHRRRDPDFLGAESYELLHTPPYGGDYAMGWVLGPEETYWHNGSNGTWYAVVSFWPREKVAGAVAANAGDSEDIAGRLDRLLNDLLNEAKAAR